MKNEVKYNPSGKVPGLKFIAFIVALLIFFCINGVFYFDDIKDFGKYIKELQQTFEDAFEEDYYDEYDKIIYKYLYDNNIDFEPLDMLYYGESSGEIEIADKQYEFEYIDGSIDFTRKYGIYPVRSYKIEDNDYAILEIPNGIILIHYEAAAPKNKYYFLDKYLSQKLVYTASSDYEPVLGEDGYIYFSGLNDEDESVLYRYNTSSHTYFEVE